jgi:hypothetical protein
VLPWSDHGRETEQSGESDSDNFNDSAARRDCSLILAENIAAETFIDNVDRLAFDNWAEHEAACGAEVGIAEMSYPRARAFRQVPRALRERLAERGRRFHSVWGAAA